MIEDRTWKYLRKIPKKYHKCSGILGHVFQINQPWHYPFRYAIAHDGSLIKIQDTAFCYLRHDNGFTPVPVAFSDNPALYHAIISLGSYLFSGNRVERYLALYKGYESLVNIPQEEFVAVRHAIAHAPVVLNRPRTVSTLRHLFGTVEVNLCDYRHLRVFFTQMATLLKTLDATLANRLVACLSQEPHGENAYRELLHDWQAAEYISNDNQPQ
jgi:hypothetical protein